MPEFLTLLPPGEALQRLIDRLKLDPQVEKIATEEACGRISFCPVLAPQPLPEFARSTVDGYAVQARDTFGAGDSLPSYLRLVGEVAMGQAPEISLLPGTCALIHTGGMLPENADAVVMLEHTQVVGGDEIEIYRPVAVGENVLVVGEDVARGEEVIPAGKRLRPAEIGGLMALGITHIQVARRPKVGILSTGDEVIPPHLQTAPGQVRDINSYSLGALAAEHGGEPIRYGIIPDRYDFMLEVARRALDECDLLLITAGSSASARDLTAQVIQELGEPGVIVHGVSVRPGKPTILGACQGKAVIGLPGNPVSALVIATIFVVPILRGLLGLPASSSTIWMRAKLTLNLASQPGREDWVPVRLIEHHSGLLAEPIFGKSNLIFTLVRADGLARVPADANGLNAGSVVEVMAL